MRRILVLLAVVCAGEVVRAQSPEPFTVRQVLSAPFASELVASPVGGEFAWVENAEGVRNVWVGGAGETARQVTKYTADDGQEIRGLVWSPFGDAVAYTYGADEGVDGKVANPAHLQRELKLEVVVLDVKSGKSVDLGAGHSPMFTRDEEAVVFIRAGQLWMSALVEGAAKRLVFDRGSASQVTISPNEKLLAFVSTRDEAKASEHSFIGLFDLEARTLQFVAPSTGVDTAPAFSPDGKQIAWLRGPFGKVKEFAANRVSNAPWSMMVADVADPSKARAVFTAEAGKVGSVLPHMSTGEPRVWWASNSKSGLIVQNSHAISHVKLASFEQKEGEDGPPPDRSIPWLLFESEIDGYVHLYGIDPEVPDSKPVEYSSGEHRDKNFEVEDVTLAPDGKMIYYASNQVSDDGLDVDRRHIWAEIVEPYFGGVGPVQITRGDGIETHPVVSSDDKLIAALVSTPRRPAHVEFIETQRISAPGGRLKPAVAKVIDAHSEQSSIQLLAAQLTSPMQVLLPASNGTKLHGQLFVPPLDAGSSAALRNERKKNLGCVAGAAESNSNSQYSGPSLRSRMTRSGEGQTKAIASATGSKHPAIIFVHGGPKRQMLLGYPGMEYYSNAYAMNQYLASRGFVVLSVNYRSGIGFGMEFRQCVGCGVNGAAEYADVLAAVRYLRSRPDVDAKRIGIWGGSYGGYLTAMALARISDMFAAGVDFSGVHDWNLEDNAGDWKQGSNAEKDAIAAKALASSPMGDLSKWRSPVLLIHGDDDPDVAYQQTPALAEALRARKVPVEELVFPDEVHDFLLHETWVKGYEAAAEFFVRVLKP